MNAPSPPVEVVVHGPTDDLALLDAVWQGCPEWTEGDAAWVTTQATGMAYVGPPHSGLLVRVGVPAGVALSVFYGERLPDLPLDRVHDTELVVGDHGFVLEADTRLERIPKRGGTYAVAVWVDAVAPGQARAVAFVFGPRQPRRLGTPRSG